jgi:GTP cyclohydrolase II
MLSEAIRLPTEYGILSVRSFENEEGCCVVVSGLAENRLPADEGPLVRLHSACAFSESLGADDCDCALQLNASLAEIATNGGVVIYVWEEGRGIGIKKKIEAIHLQQREGIDTRAAFERLGYVADPRTYSLAVAALVATGVGPRVRLATRNPAKVAALEAAGFVVQRVTLPVALGERAKAYLDEKRLCLGHHSDEDCQCAGRENVG